MERGYDLLIDCGALEQLADTGFEILNSFFASHA